jgi:four helix bundle protein
MEDGEGGVRVAIIRGFRDLNVYRMAVREAKRIFEISRRFPPEERYSLTDQMRRASRAVGGMIAEAWARRRYPAAFANKLDEAMAESAETQAWLDHALECGYISQAEHRTLDAFWQSIGAKLNRMIERTDDFCRTASSTR